MTDLLSATSTAIDLVRRLRDINKNIANAEFANALADLTMELSELKLKVSALLEENDRLKRELQKKQSKNLQFKDFAYYDAQNDGPYCPGCYDSNGKAVRLSATPKDFSDLASHICPVCNAAFGGKGI